MVAARGGESALRGGGDTRCAGIGLRAGELEVEPPSTDSLSGSSESESEPRSKDLTLPSDSILDVAKVPRRMASLLLLLLVSAVGTTGRPTKSRPPLVAPPPVCALRTAAMVGGGGWHLS